jgi:hypothetical protein
MGLLNNVPGVFGFGVFALIGVDDECEGLELFLDLFFRCSGLQLQDVVGVVEFLVGESLELHLDLEALGLERLELLAVVVSRAFGFLALLHSLILLNLNRPLIFTRG